MTCKNRISHLGDPRAENFEESFKKEIEALVKIETCKVVCYDETPQDAYVWSSRFVLAKKDEVTDKQISKERFVYKGTEIN